MIQTRFLHACIDHTIGHLVETNDKNEVSWAHNKYGLALVVNEECLIGQPLNEIAAVIDWIVHFAILILSYNSHDSINIAVDHSSGLHRVETLFSCSLPYDKT